MTRAMRIWERTLLAVAVLWAAALPILALLFPAYSGESVEMSSNGTTVTTASSATMVQVDGRQVLITMSVPLAVAVLVTVLLSIRTRRAWPLALAWTAAGLLAIATVLAMLSVGLFVLPITVCLIAACAIGAAGIGSGPMAAAPRYGMP